MARLGKRKLMLAGLCFLALLALALLSMPLWFPAVLRPVISSRGIHYAEYERASYSTFNLHGVSFTNNTTAFHAATFRGLTPIAWVWRQHVSKRDLPYVHVEGWSLVMTNGSRNSNSNSSVSVAQTYQGIERAVAAVAKWLPAAILTNGVI